MKTAQFIRLIQTLAWNDFKIRYQGSVLGYVWTLMKPLMLFGVLYTVFSIFMRFPVEHYQLYLLLGIIIWNFFAESTAIALQSLVNKSGILTKMYLPKTAIVFASLITSFLTLILNLIVFVFFVAFSPISFSFQFLLLPLFLFEIFLLSLGISFFLSLIFVKFRDIAHIWDIVLQMGFWLTPIIYPLSMIENPAYHWVFRINPIASIINHARNLIILGQVPDLRTHLIFLLALISFALGSYAFFQSKEEGIVENL